jgi:hypothetical protein
VRTPNPCRGPLTWLAATAALLAAPAAPAIEWFPEFQSLTEAEQALFEGPVRLNKEYQSDVLTYRKPEHWEYLWLTHDLAFDFSVGSPGAVHFLVDNRAKLRTRLADAVELRFTHFEERNLERDSVHSVAELVFWPWPRAGFVLYGEPSLYKREDDTGLALLLKPQDRHEIRLFNTFIDVTRLKRNDRTDTYVEPDLPYARGLVGRVWQSPEEAVNYASGSRIGDFLEYAFRWETRTRWLFPDEKYEYAYWKGFASAFLSRKLAPGFHLNARFQLDRKLESRAPTDPTSAVPAAFLRTTRAFATARAVLPTLGPSEDWELTAGLEYAYRLWEAREGPYAYRDFLPHFWLSFPAFGNGVRRDRFAVGLEATWHRSSGDPAAFAFDEESAAVDGRLNLSYDFHFGGPSAEDPAYPKAVLRLVVTGDIDELGTRQSWEGGNGQFRVHF